MPFIKPSTFRLVAGVAALSLATALAGCAGMPTNAALDSVHQPVVQRNSYTIDVATDLASGVTPAEQRRLAGWFETMNLGYGDKVAIDDPAESPDVRNAIGNVAGRFGLTLAPTAPITDGEVYPGTVRVVVTRTTAMVPGCPDWSAKSDANLGNATSKNYGCAVNGNLAAMVANKEDLVHGAQARGETVVMSSSKAIESYRAMEPTGKAGLKETSSKSGGGN